MKKMLLGFILGLLIWGGIVYATSYFAKDISYQPSDETWNVSNVNEAINSLYEISQRGSCSINSNLTLTYSGGGHISVGKYATSSMTIINNNYGKLKITSGSADIVFKYTDGTSSSLSLSSGIIIIIPDNVESIAFSSKSSIAGNDGYMGQWLSATTTVQFETSKNSNNDISFTYSGGGYVTKDLTGNSSGTLINDGYKKINVTSGTVAIVFNYEDDTSSASTSITAGNSLLIPENVKSISYSSSSTSTAGEGGKELYGTATIQIEK